MWDKEPEPEPKRFSGSNRFHFFGSQVEPEKFVGTGNRKRGEPVLTPHIGFNEIRVLGLRIQNYGLGFKVQKL